MIVVDTNILAYLLIPGKLAGDAEYLYEQDKDWAVPLLWRSEFRNVLAQQVRRRALSFEQACSIQRRAETLVHDAEHMVDSIDVLQLASQSRCTAYDCEFVALALQLETKLVTADREVLQEFPGIAVPFN